MTRLPPDDDETRSLRQQVRSLVRVEQDLYELQGRLDDQLRLYRGLHDVGRKLAATRNLDEVYRLGVHFVVYGLDLERGLVLRHDERRGAFLVKAMEGYYGLDAPPVARLSVAQRAPWLAPLLDGAGQIFVRGAGEGQDAAEAMGALALDCFAVFPLAGRRRPIETLLIAGNTASGAPYHASLEPGGNHFIGLSSLASQLATAAQTCLYFAELEEDRRRIRGELRQQEERYRALAMAIPELLVELDEEGRITWRNPVAADVLGSLEASADFISYMATEEARGQARERLAATAAGEARPKIVETPIRRRDGRTRLYAFRCNPRRDGEGTLRGFVVTGRDVTGPRNLERQLREAHRLEAIGRLAGGVAHDFNNVLTIIRGNAEHMATLLPEEHELNQELASIIRGSDRAADLIEHLQDFACNQVAEPKPICINETVTALRKFLERALGDTVRLVLDLADEVPAVMADPGQLEQILLNLALNAKDAIAGEGEVTIATAAVEPGDDASGATADLPPGRYVSLAMTDTGCGMDEATRLLIFEPFFTTKDDYRGTGLGLSSVYGMVRQGGGTVTVASEPGRGSTFRIYLPVASDRSLQGAQPPEEA